MDKAHHRPRLMMQSNDRQTLGVAILPFLSPTTATSLLFTFPQAISATLMRTENATETEKGKRREGEGK